MARAITIELLGNAKEFTKATEQAVGGVSKLTGAMGVATGVLAAFGIGLTGAFEVKSAIDKTAALGEEVFRMTKIFGLSAESASKWLYVAQATGVNSESLQKSFKILSKNLETVQLKLDTTHKLGLSPFNEEMKRLGVNITDRQGNLRDFQAILLDTADAFQKLGPAADLAGHATIVFGKGGVDLIPILQLGKQGILDLENEAQKYGLVITSDNLPKIHDYIEAHRHLDAAMQGMQLTIGQALIPILTSLTEKVTGAFQAIRTWIGDNPATITALQHFGEAGVNFAVRAINGLIQVISGGAGGRGVHGAMGDINGDMRATALAAGGSQPDSLASSITAVSVKLTDFLNSKSTKDFITFWQNLADKVSTAAYWLGVAKDKLDAVGNGSAKPGQKPGITIGQTDKNGKGGFFIPLPFAKGLDYVPYDNFPALLHKGERVLTAEQARGQGPTAGGFGAGRGGGVNVYINIAEGAFIDGPSVDRLANTIAQRLTYATGR